MSAGLPRFGDRLPSQSWPAVFVLVCLYVPPANAQQATVVSAEPTPWTHQNHLNDPAEFQFAIVSDNAANPRQGVFESAAQKLQLLRPEFVLSVGDFIHGYGEGFVPLTDEPVVRAKRKAFDQILSKLTAPFYRVAGNHDINNDLSAAIWKELYGPDYYSFVYQKVLFLCLNSQDGPNYKAGIGAEQIAWVKEELADHSDARWVCLFFHQPLWLDDAKRLERAKKENGATVLTGFDQVEKLLDGRNFTVFAGHHHTYGKWVKNGNTYFRLATTGGASPLTGPETGKFDHVMWITITEKGPIVCNLLLEGILDGDAKRVLPERPKPTE